MTKEDKELLLVDLLARLPYGIKIRLGDYDYQVCGYNSEKEMPVKIWYYYDSNLTLKSYIDVYLTDYRPYLRQMSSMTEEEKIELYQIAGFYYLSNNELLKDEWRQFSGALSENKLFLPYPIWEDNLNKVYDWLNKHHFDYRGLIEKGLAIEVTKENNPYEN